MIFIVWLILMISDEMLFAMEKLVFHIKPSKDYFSWEFYIFAEIVSAYEPVAQPQLRPSAFVKCKKSESMVLN